MVLEIRALKGAVITFLIALGLVFLPWEFVFPAFGVAYAAYKLRYYRERIGVYTSQGDQLSMGQWLGASTVIFVALLLGSRGLAVFSAQGTGQSNWDLGLLNFFAGISISLTDPSLVGNVIIPLAIVGAVLFVPLFALAFVGAQFRERLLTGVDSSEAAIRASIWESLVRVPIYLLWATVLTFRPLFKRWRVLPDQLGAIVGVNGGAPDTSPFIAQAAGTENVLRVLGEFDQEAAARDALSSQLDVVFVDVGNIVHLVPVVVIGTFFAVKLTKYSSEEATVPEVLGYRGLYPPKRSTSIVANVGIPLALFGLYAAGVVTYSGVALLDPLLLVAVVVAVVGGVDLRGSTIRFARETGDGLPGIGGDAVVVGLVAGAYTIAAGALVGELVGVPDFTFATALLFPVIAVPLGYGANRAMVEVKTGNIEDLTDRIEADPDSVTEREIDQLLAHVHARDDGLRAAGLSGLATAAGASLYREDEALEEFVSAIRLEDEQFARPALKGVVKLLRGRRALETVDRLTDEEILEAVATHLEASDAVTRELAVEAYARIIVVGFTTEEVERPPLGEVEGLPIARIEEILGDEPEDRDLASAVVTAFAHLWYSAHRSTDESRYARADLETTLSAEDEQRLLVDLVRWSAFADEDARGMASFALTSDEAIVETGGLETVMVAVDSEEPMVRYMAAHVLTSSMSRHANRIDPNRLLRTLDDPDEQARGAGAEAVYAFVESAPEERRSAVVEDIVAHLDDRDPSQGGTAESALLRALDLIPPGQLVEYPNVTRTVAEYIPAESPTVSEPAARVLAELLQADPEARHDDTVMSAIEDGLTHDSAEVREHCVAAAAAVIAASPDDGRPFVEGLVLNLGATDRVGEMAISGLSRVLDEYPGYGTEVLPEMAAGLENPTPISRQYAGAMIAGKNISEVTAELAGDVTDEGVSRGENLIEPLVNLAGNVGGATREAVFQALSNLAEEYPEEARGAITTVTGALDEGSVRVRRNAAGVLEVVAQHYPQAVEPVAENLAVAIDDSDTRTRAIALNALNELAKNNPAAIASDIRRVIGRLDDDSSIVRERAAEVIVTLAETDPGLVDPAAEASDRLRRLQRDPAVDIEGETLQSAASAVQTGTPTGEAEAAGGGGGGEETRVWNVEDADEAGTSGDTRVFDPSEGGDDFGGDVDMDEGEFEFDEDAEAEAGDEGDEDGETIIMEVGDDDEAEADDEDGETIIMEPDEGDDAEDEGDEDGETIIMSPDEGDDEDEAEADDEGDDEDGETIIMSPDEGDDADDAEGDDEDGETIIMSPDDDGDEAEADDEDGETIIMQPDEGDADDEADAETEGDDEDGETIIMTPDEGDEADEDEAEAGDEADEAEGDDEDGETIIMTPDDDGDEDDDEDEAEADDEAEAAAEGDDEDGETIIMQPDEGDDADEGDEEADAESDDEAEADDEDGETIIMTPDDGDDAGDEGDGEADAGDGNGSDEDGETIIMSPDDDGDEDTENGDGEAQSESGDEDGETIIMQPDDEDETDAGDEDGETIIMQPDDEDGDD